MRLNKRVAAIGLSLFVISTAGAGVAQALPGGPWASKSAPLKVNYAGYSPVGYSYGVWQGFREDQGRGSRIQDLSYGRAISGYNGSDRGTYTKHQWYWNGNSCYVTSFSEAGASVSCGTGWHGAGSTNSGSNNSSTWKSYETWDGIDPTGNSGRAQMYTCWNVVAAPDSCSGGNYLRGAKYDD